MKNKSSIVSMVIVLTLISLVSGAILTLANNKFSPIIIARESDKMRIVAEQLLPEGSQITKVTRYTELASLVSNARKDAGLSSEWSWDPNAAPAEVVETTPEPAPAPVIEMDWGAWDDWDFDDFEEDSDEVVDADAEATATTSTEVASEESVEELSWADLGLDFGEVSVGAETTVAEADDFDDFDFDSLFGEIAVPVAPESTGGTTDESPEEVETPAFEIYQAVQNGKLVGVAVISKAKGYGGDVVIMLALDGTLEKVIGMQVLQQSETAGLGSLITGEKFTSQFTDKPVGNPFEVGKDIQGVASATVSSKAVANAIQSALRNLEQFLIDGTVKEGA